MTGRTGSADHLIRSLGLQPIEGEGAWWAPGPRTARLSCIIVLLTDAPDGFSALHRLTVDEGWQWLDGAPARLLCLGEPSGPVILDTDSGQVVVPAGTWQGATTLGAWTLASCWCSPAFTWAAFTLGERASLQTAYPARSREITDLTREATVH